jgi:hypothetical protein
LGELNVNVNEKLAEIKRAIESCGIIVTEVGLNTSIDTVDVIGKCLPQVIRMNLFVKFGLELKLNNGTVQAQLTSKDKSLELNGT